MIGSGRALLRSTSADLARRNTRTREARHVFGRGGLLGDGTPTGYLPHVRCYNIRRGRPRTHSYTPFTHACIHTRAHTHTHVHTHIYTYSHSYVHTRHTRTHIRTTQERTHTHKHTHTLCVPDEKRATQYFFFFRRLLIMPKIFLVFLITRCIY